MIDPRFYNKLEPITAAILASRLGLSVVGGDPDKLIKGVGSLANAGANDLTYLDSAKHKEATAKAGICLVPNTYASSFPTSVTTIACPHPKDAFAQAAPHIAFRKEFASGQGPQHAKSEIAEGVTVAPGAVLGEGTQIGTGTTIGANTVIGPGVQIGRNCAIGSNVSLMCALLGDKVSILAGAVIGEGGFGVARDGSGTQLVPHFGRVILQDGVSIGANSCVDRGMLDDTIVGERTHIDNLCHIGHNVRIGAGCAMAAFGGVSGSVEIGDNVQFGGRAGMADHISIGTGARIAAGAAVLSDVPEGATYAGYPAKPSRTWMRELAWLARAAQKRSDDKA